MSDQNQLQVGRVSFGAGGSGVAPSLHGGRGMLKTTARTSIIDDMIETVALLNEVKATGAALQRAGSLVDRIKDHVYRLGVSPDDPRLEAW